MTELRMIGGHDTPEIVLRVWAAERVPGLWNAEVVGPDSAATRSLGREFWDLTTGQVNDVARQLGARIERLG